MTIDQQICRIDLQLLFTVLSIQNFHILLKCYTKSYSHTIELSLLTANIKWIEEYAWYRHNDISRTIYEHNAALWSATEYVNGGPFTFIWTYMKYIVGYVFFVCNGIIECCLHYRLVVCRMYGTSKKRSDRILFCPTSCWMHVKLIRHTHISKDSTKKKLIRNIFLSPYKVLLIIEKSKKIPPSLYFKFQCLWCYLYIAFYSIIYDCIRSWLCTYTFTYKFSYIQFCKKKYDKILITVYFCSIICRFINTS